jgi:hypothetical protein
MPRSSVLIRLPFLPFPVAFDIMFRHGGFVAFAGAHGGGEEAMYQFWRIFFVSSPVGKIYPARIGQWVEAMCACHAVQCLRHPAHAVYLLRPMRYEIPESVAAWTVVGGGCNQTMRPEFLVHAMCAFLPAAEYQPLLQREWFRVEEVQIRRSVRGWLRFADEVISNHFFTRHWWSGPFHPLGVEEGSTMGRVIVELAQREMHGLKKGIMQEETEVMIRAKEIKEWKASAEKHKVETMPNRKKGDAPKKREILLKHPCIKKKEAAVTNEKGEVPKKPEKATKSPSTTLSAANKQEIERLTHVCYTQQTSILARTRAAISSMRVVTLENNFKRVLCLVVSLSHQHPRIKWSIRMALHQVALEETGRSSWDIERDLYRVMYSREHNPLKGLEQMRFNAQ